MQGAGYSLIVRKLKMLDFISSNFARIGDAAALLSAAGELSHGTMPYSSNHQEECIIEGAKKIGWKDKWHKPGAAPGPNKHGIGMALGGYPFRSGLGAATIRINPDGTGHLLVGVTDIGTGAKSTMAIVASEALGIPLNQIQLTNGDTDVTPFSIGESGSRTVLGAVAPIPWRAAKAEEFLRGKKIDEGTAQKAGEIALEGATPMKDNAYKVGLAKSLVHRALLASV